MNGRLRIAGIPMLIAAMLFAATVAPAARAEGTAAQNDAHLTRLNKKQLEELLKRMKVERKFTLDSITCFKAFLAARKSGRAKLAKNPKAKLTAGEQSAVGASVPGQAQAWVDNCLKTRFRWTGMVAAGWTDAHGEVQVGSKPAGTKKPPKPAKPLDPLATAYKIENDRVTEVHESSHVAGVKSDAKALGLDIGNWQKWGAVKKKLDKLLEELTGLSLDQALKAIADPDGFMRTTGGMTFSSGRYLAQRAKSAFNADEMKILIWAYKNRQKLQQMYNRRHDAERSAAEEIREYRHHLTYLDTRIARYCALLGKSADPACEKKVGSRIGTGDDSGTGFARIPAGTNARPSWLGDDPNYAGGGGDGGGDAGGDAGAQ